MTLVVTHQCCGCSCDVCKVSHRGGIHTSECLDRYWAEAHKNGLRAESHVASNETVKEASLADDQ